MSRLPVYFIIPFLLSFGEINSQGLFEQSLVSSDSALASPLSFSGFVRSTIYAGNHDESPVYLQSVYSQVSLEASISAGKFGDAYAEMRYRTGYEFQEKFSKAELREAYVKLYLGPLAVQAGKQIISWGSTSFLNPTDQFSPMDPTFRSPESEDLRKGVWALSTNFSISSSSSFYFIWMPLYEPSVLLTDAFSFPDYLSLNDHQSRNLDISDGSFALKYDLRSAILDLDLSYFNGYRNTPSLALDTAIFNMTSFQPELLRLSQRPYRINMAGLNMTIPAGSYLFRLEAAWMDPAKEQEYDPHLPLSELSYVAEIEQSGANVSLIAGYYGKYLPDFIRADFNPALLKGEMPPISDIFPPGVSPSLSGLSSFLDTEIKGFNRLINYQQYEISHSAYAILKMSAFNDLIDLEIPVMYNFTVGELTLMPSLAFKIADGFSFKLGAYSIFGKENTLYDLIGPGLNAGFGMLQLKF